MHHDEVAAQAAGPVGVRARHVQRRLLATASPTTSASATYAYRGASPSRRGRARRSTTIAVSEKRPNNEIVLECAVVNENGEAKIQGEAVAVLPADG
jgi:hypothetical protein